MRGLSVPDLVRTAVAAARRPLDTGTTLVGPRFDGRTEGAPPPRRNGKSYDVTHWREVGAVYRAATAARQNVQAAVRDKLGASDLRVAARWIAKARKMGFLDEPGLNYYFRLGPDEPEVTTNDQPTPPAGSPFGR